MHEFGKDAAYHLIIAVRQARIAYMLCRLHSFKY